MLPSRPRSISRGGAGYPGHALVILCGQEWDVYEYGDVLSYSDGDRQYLRNFLSREPKQCLYWAIEAAILLADHALSAPPPEPCQVEEGAADLRLDSFVQAAEALVRSGSPAPKVSPTEASIRDHAHDVATPAHVGLLLLFHWTVFRIVGLSSYVPPTMVR